MELNKNLLESFNKKQLTHTLLQQLKSQINCLRTLRPTYCNLKIYHDRLRNDIEILQKTILSEKNHSQLTIFSDLIKEVKQTQQKLIFYQKEMEKMIRKQKSLQNQLDNEKKITFDLKKNINKLQEIQIKEAEKLQTLMKNLENQKIIQRQTFTKMKLEEKQVYKYEGKLQMCIEKQKQYNVSIDKERQYIRDLNQKNHSLHKKFQQKDQQIQRILKYNQKLEDSMRENMNRINDLHVKNSELKVRINTKLQQKQKYKDLITQLLLQKEEKNSQFRINQQKQIHEVQQIKIKSQIIVSVQNQIQKKLDQTREEQKILNKNSQFLSYLKTYQRQLKQANILLYKKLKQNCEEDQFLRQTVFRFRLRV